MPFASGKKALAICNRCGHRVKYTELRREWTNLDVCPDCYDEKHPQLGPFKARSDPQALYNPSPDRKEPLEVQVGENKVFPPWYNGSLHAVGQVGTVTVVIT